jgi:Zn-dependent peptidase ImmA (M78 family)
MQRSERGAQELLSRFDIQEPPVPVEQMAEALGVQLQFVPYENEMSGMLYRDKEREATVIGINSFHAPTRQRFSIGHELGHLMLHTQRLMFVDKLFRVASAPAETDVAHRREEIEANSFAAALLMPEQFIDDALHRYVARGSGLEGEDLLRDLARRFAVSPEAMQYRLTNLGRLIP